jgi:hypothetical protein
MNRNRFQCFSQLCCSTKEWSTVARNEDGESKLVDYGERPVMFYDNVSGRVGVGFA